MKQTFLPKVSEAVRVNIRHRQWQHALLAMAAVVVFITVYMLILPAITMTGPTCGLEEHTHSDSCYELRLVCGLEETPEGDAAHVHGPACYEQQQVLTCGQEEGSGHTHTDACMGCVCGQEEGAGHTHTDACYADVTVEELTCTQEESAGHTHDASCYTVEEELTCGMSEGEGGHEHDDGCCDPETGELTCGMSEGEGGHEHDEGCYTQTETLTCTQEESAGHTHDASCYTQTVERQLVCGQEETEGHVHTDACMGYTCGQEESAGHTHTEACYTTQDVLICGESEGHTHTDACYEQVLVCQIPEHTHTEECYASGEEPPVEEIPEEDVPLGEYACGKEEHAHTQDCYDVDGNLICALEEHAHDESCLAEELPEYICGKEEHAHTQDCYDADGNLICALEGHTHDETCLPVEQEPGAFPEELPEGYGEYEYEDADSGLSVLAYAPEGAFEEDVELQAQVLDQDSDAYADAQANLEDAGALDENTGMAALDISFRNADGDEVEPDPAAGPVYVRLDARALIPDGVDESTVAVQHHAETTDGGLFGTGIFAGTEVEVETVADSSGDTGEVTLTPSARPLAAPLSLPAETEEAPEEEAAAALDVEARFAVESFSMFTITWVDGGNRTVTLHYVDTRGRTLETSFAPTGSETVTMEGSALLSDYAAPVSGYVYESAHLYRASGTEIARISYNYIDREWYYTTPWYPNNWQEFASRNTYDVDVYLVYEVAEQPTEVGTVDSTSKGVYMYMFNYDAPAFDGATWEQFTGTKVGLTSNTTQGQGEYYQKFPTLSSTDNYTLTFPYGNSLADYFSPTGYNNTLVSDVREVNHLFLDSVYNAESTKGTFYYSSFENFATLVGLDGTDNVTDFQVYNTLGTPSSEDAFYYKRGNFMPYNGLNLEEKAADNRYDEYGEELSRYDAAYDLPVYGLSDKADYYFGMYLYANFYQPKDGLYNDDEMVFYFNGDDDMWVYIDGVLVLDLGGCHDAQSGRINFTTGTVEWTHNSTPENHGFDQQTTILSRFLNAGKEQSTRWDGNTFADGTFHTIQVFYMERGAGASNLKMSFNLPTVPDGSLSVRKDVENYFNAQMQDISYEMQLLDENGDPINTTYKLMGSDETYETGVDGTFSLRHDETAVFEEIPGDANVTVKEIGVTPGDAHRVDELYDITCTVTNSSGQVITGTSEVKNEYNEVVGVTLTMPAAGTANVVIKNTATFTAPVTVTKNFTNDGQTAASAPDGFEATFTVYEGESTEPIGSVAYSEFEDGSYTFWLEEDKTYRIVEEIQTEGAYGENVYRNTTVTVADGQAQQSKTATVEVEQGVNLSGGVKVEFDNIYGASSADLTIVKNIYGLSADQVEKLVEGEYRADSGLRFDVDTFESFDKLIKEEEKPDNSKYYNYTDWTFNVADTLDESGIVNNHWGQHITANPNGNSIDSDHGSGKNPNEERHFGNASLVWVADSSEELGGYWKYTVKISDIDISENNIFRVWEQRLEVDGFKASTSVAEYPTEGEDTITSWYTTVNKDNHGNKATAFELTQDTTVEFTNRYSQGKLSVTKALTVNNIPITTGTDRVFTFQISIPEEWANSANEEHTPIEYQVTYSRENEGTHTDGVITFAQDGSTTIELYAGETATISLPVGITPVVSEINYDGYAPEWEDTNEVPEGGASDILTRAGATITTNAISANDPIEVTCTNTTGAVLPSTGGPGVANILTLGTLLTLGAGAVLLLQRRRKEGDAC